MELFAKSRRKEKTSEWERRERKKEKFDVLSFLFFFSWTDDDDDDVEGKLCLFNQQFLSRQETDVDKSFSLGRRRRRRRRR